MHRLFLKKYIYLILILSIVISGCKTDMKEIQHLNYATALGVDFVDGKYHLFVQLIGLDAVAKREGEVSSPLTYISESTGATFLDAFFDLYKSGQEKFVWAHITAIVISESVLKEGLEDVLDELTRYYEFRLTPWIFATVDPIEKVLSTLGLFNQPTLETIMHNPERMNKQNSLVRPIKLYQFFREVLEPARTTYLPSLTINKKQWTKNQKDDNKLALDGAFFVQNHQYKGYFTLDELKGLRWISPKSERVALKVPENKSENTIVVFEDVESNISVVNPNNLTYRIKVSAEGSIGNKVVNHESYNHLLEKTKESMEKEIEELYHLSKEKNTDFLNLEHSYYRKHYEKWKKTEQKELFLAKTDINISLELTIEHTGAFKNYKFDTVTNDKK